MSRPDYEHARATSSLLPLSLLLVVAEGAAVDLRNADERSYDIRIQTGAVTIHTSIAGNTTRLGLTDTGTVIVIGAGSFRAEGLRTVHIRDGILHFEP